MKAQGHKPFRQSKRVSTLLHQCNTSKINSPIAASNQHEFIISRQCRCTSSG
ncbi:MAG TPA: hypothetical protein O0W81_04625 [Methanocorpusculum sp.]|nr:hypothetical protein [Methanocorpusculum sp.]